MSVAWWGAISVGGILSAIGLYVTVVAQDAVAYIRSCGQVVAVCNMSGNLKTMLFLNPSLTVSLQQAQAFSLAGLAALGVGLVLVAYGDYLHPAARKPEMPSAGTVG